MSNCPKSVLVTPSRLDGLDPSGSSRYGRTLKYLYYYRAIADRMGLSSARLMDNASTLDLVHKVHLETEKWADFPVYTTYFSRELKKTGGPFDYPYCWRALYEIKSLIEEGHKKVVLIDSDCFVLSGRLADFVRETHSGWVTLWCKRWNFPESSFQILCEDTFPMFLEFCKPPYSAYNGQCMERILPFTEVRRDFDSDRYGETRAPAPPGCDLYCQAPLDMEMLFVP